MKFITEVREKYYSTLCCTPMLLLVLHEIGIMNMKPNKTRGLSCVRNCIYKGQPLFPTLTGTNSNPFVETPNQRYRYLHVIEAHVIGGHHSLTLRQFLYIGVLNIALWTYVRFYNTQYRAQNWTVISPMHGHNYCQTTHTYKISIPRACVYCLVV